LDLKKRLIGIFPFFFLRHKKRFVGIFPFFFLRHRKRFIGIFPFFPKTKKTLDLFLFFLIKKTMAQKPSQQKKQTKCPELLRMCS